MTNRQLFLQHVGQTSPAPIGLEIVRAEGVYMYDAAGKPYLDLISGFSVMNMGHGNAAVKAAINRQVDQYMHLMVYGEIVENPQVQYAKLLTQYLPENLDCVFFTNSGTEATEGAMKLAKRVTNRSQIIAFKNAYHGSTQGALSIMGSEYFRQAFRPLLPDVLHEDFNTAAALSAITTKTAAVVMEVIQAEAGVIAADHNWLKAMRQRCTETGTLLIFDEIQTGFGRTGTLWAFEHYAVVPDILLLGKALGGGLPLGAFISSNAYLHQLTYEPVLGHISTFAGHPVCCAAGMASFGELVKLIAENHELNSVKNSEALFQAELIHPAIKAIRSKGLLMALEFENAEICQRICHACVQAGLVTDWFLFAPNCLRIAPPFIVSENEIKRICKTILSICDARG